MKVLIYVFVLGFIVSCSADGEPHLAHIKIDAKSQDILTMLDMGARDLETRDQSEQDTQEDSADLASELPLTELHKYVQKEDEAFKYKLVKEFTTNKFRHFIFRVTSQTWRTSDEVDRTIWEHDVFLIIPPNMDTDSVILLIDGGINKKTTPDEFPAEAILFRNLAKKTRSAFAVVRQNPNQPLTFKGSGAPNGPVEEDDLVAYTWRKLVEEKDPTWAAYFPMTKGVIRSMDALQDYAEKNIQDIKLDKFIATGFSKRGATTYLVAAADERVIALAPGVFDILGLNQQMKHHFGAYGFWAPAVTPYVTNNLAQYIDTPEIDFLAKHIDPLSFVDYLTEPKFLIMASGDEFFLPDAAQSYFGELKGDKVMRMYTNTGHSLESRVVEVISDLGTWILQIVDQKPTPVMTWLRTGNKLEVSATPVPTAAGYWSVTNPNARDFRNTEVGSNWKYTKLELRTDGKYEIDLPEPTEGFSAFIMDLKFDKQNYSTPAFVSPDILPFTFVKK